MDVRARATSGLGWATGHKLVQLGLRFGVSVALMRLLGPEEFGLVAVILIFSSFGSVFGEMGFSSALVQHRSLGEEHRSTTFWTNLAIAGGLAGALALAAPAVASVYGEPRLHALTLWMSLCLPFSAAGLVSRALLQKALRFDVLARANIATLLVAGVIAIGLAAAGGGVWSLVVGDLVGAGFGSALLLGAGGWRPRLLWSRHALRDLVAFGVGITGFKIITYWARAADKLLVGKFIGVEALGLYSRASTLVLNPLHQMLSVLSPVMFPALSALGADVDRVRRAFLRAVECLTFLLFPATLGFVAVADVFTMGLLGPAWRDAILVSQILALVATTQSVTYPVGWIFTSQNRTDLLFWWGVAGSSVLVLSVAIGIVTGRIETVALAYLAGNLVITLPCLAAPGRLIGMTLGDVWQCVRLNLLCAIVMATLVWAAGRLAPTGTPPLLQLAVQVVMGTAIYAGLARWLRPNVLQELTGLYRQLVSRPRGVATMVRPRPGVT